MTDAEQHFWRMLALGAVVALVVINVWGAWFMRRVEARAQQMIRAAKRRRKRVKAWNRSHVSEIWNGWRYSHDGMLRPPATPNTETENASAGSND